MGIARNSIEDLKKRTKISDFILSTTTGKLRGSKGMALCPFHGEKTASMSFTDVENLFHCFGCKEGGDVFKYVQEINNIEFQDAVEFVADNYGFKLSYTDAGQNEDFKKYQSKMNIISEYFIETMESKASKKAIDYLKSRGFDISDIKKYGVSFIDSDLEKFKKYCKNNEINNQDLKRLGFMSSNDNFLFKNRILFPILNIRTEIVAFGGRALDDFGPKYLNSSESLLYKKNKNLYFTKDFISSIKKKGYVFLVEGYFDVLALNKLGYSNVVSPSGTALTTQQLEVLSRYTKKILLCFDNDEAGLVATERVVELRNQVGSKLEIHCLNLPVQYKDLSELFENNPESFKDVLKDNFDLVEFLLDKFLEKDKDKQRIFDYFQKLSKHLSPLELDVSLDLLSKKINTPKDILKKELNFQSKNETKKYDSSPASKSISAHLIFQDIVTADILRNKFYLDEQVSEILNMSDEFSKIINDLKKNGDKDNQYTNISYTPEQYSESISRLYLHFANLKIDKLIDEFESSQNKDFSLLQSVEDIKKKIEIYQSTL
ncbi:DNA primase [Acidimicrobiaceae bacterium]|nr:DNA primase [Acidimicrobiaceae bacterium]|tara:strand:+ start:9951 stop:11588 length:1638 start_codon:yes stop_codon:yes gene_type:complete